MAETLLTKRIEFSAAHRYHNQAWDEATNRWVFGACHNEPGHGHNYLLEVTVAGPVDRHTGMVVNLFDLKIVLQKVLEEFDHKHLNLDTPYFARAIPTTENIATVLWNKLSGYPEIGRLDRIRLCEEDDLWADLTAETHARRRASVTRRYHFSASLPAANARAQGQTGHDYALEVTVGGEIHPVSGMVTDIGAMDRVVQELILRRFTDRNLGQDPAFASRPLTGETLAQLIWSLLVKAIPTGQLQQIRLVESDGLIYDYAEREAVSSSADGR
ncbi:MAG TPA: 6-carboxytetrahydropterin synthase [Nitrospiraceae bacterium]|nr:6-carboxytetrahydropterin synthase [Nitrospiraceae bacterium]